MGLAIVTGASRGIGRDVAVGLAGAGYTVACLARSEPELRTLEASGPRLLAVPVDVTDGPALRAAVEALVALHGPCEILVNNAGYGLRAAVEEIPLDEWRREFELNLFSATHLIQLVLPGMRAARAGCIVNVSSVAGRLATPFSGAYCATKFALEGLSDSLRNELRPFGIRVVLVEPGPVKTDFLRAAAAVSDPILDRADSPYAAGYRAVLTGLADLHRDGWSSEAVAERIVAAALSPSPPLRVAAYSWVLGLAVGLRAVWPAMFDRVLQRRFG